MDKLNAEDEFLKNRIMIEKRIINEKYVEGIAECNTRA